MSQPTDPGLSIAMSHASAGDTLDVCPLCPSAVPSFYAAAHARWHQGQADEFSAMLQQYFRQFGNPTTLAQDASKTNSALSPFPKVESSPTQATEPNSSTPASVWILLEESNGDSHGMPDQCVLGVFATLGAAENAEANARIDRQSEGKRVAGYEDDDDSADWDYSYAVEEHQVQR